MIELLNNLPETLVSFITFIITILFLVTIHEFGHFWVARRFGVRIEKFSIGFGKPIIKWYGKKDNTEYSISWIPLGGYVKMYGEGSNSPKNTQENSKNDQAEISDIYDSKSGKFSELPPSKRMAIAFAGPAVNLLFAIFAFWLLLIIGVGGIKPIVGTITKDSIVDQAKIIKDDTIISINQHHIQTANDVSIALIDAIGNPKTSIRVQRDNHEKDLYLNLDHLAKGSELNIEKTIGLNWKYLDLIYQAPAKIGRVIENSPAQKAGVQVDDLIIGINQTPISTWLQMASIIRKSQNQPLDIRIKRGEKIINLSVLPKDNVIGIGGQSVDPKKFEQLKTVKRYGPLEAIPQSIQQVYLLSALQLKTLGRLIIGEASIKNMGGPLTIADISGQSIRIGYEAYFNLLALISLALAVMNLLPIPALDGGHILLCTAEMIKGRPLSEKTTNILMRLGVTILLSFMALVIGLDFFKYLSKLF